MTSNSDPSSTSVESEVADLYRDHWGRLLSILVARTRRLDLAEDALSEAFVRASERWPAAGVPTNPCGWLYTTANRLVVGGLRAEAIRGRNTGLLAVGSGWVQESPTVELDKLDDDRLAVILLCCHPALNAPTRSALALRLVIGTTTAEIARLFLVPTATMAARITRGKKKIVAAGIPLWRPVDDELLDRLDDVCRTIYLAFTAGYTPGTGPNLLRSDLAGEAVGLAAILHHLVPDAKQVQALLGLLTLQHARRDARVEAGRLVTLGEQDRGLWHGDELTAGIRLVTELAAGESCAGGQRFMEELRLQGLIAVEHGRAQVATETDWATIADIYRQLEELTGSPVVRLNRSVAVAEAEGARAGLALLEELQESMPQNHRFYAVRAELATRDGNVELARAAYRRALRLCANRVETEYLQTQLDKLGD